MHAGAYPRAEESASRDGTHSPPRSQTPACSPASWGQGGGLPRVLVVLVSGLAPGAELLYQGDTSAARNLLAPEGRVFCLPCQRLPLPRGRGTAASQGSLSAHI